MATENAVAVGPAHSPDYGLLVITLALSCIGIVMVYSASLMAGFTEHNNQAYFFQRQLLWCALGLAVMFVLMWLPYRVWRGLSLVGLIVSIGLLVAVLLPGLGKTELGATRWITIGHLRVGQPSELCKVTLVIYLADLLARKGERVKDFAHGFVPFAVILLTIFFLVMKQPDMGTALVIVASAVTIFYVSGASLGQIIPAGAIGMIGLALLTLSSGYRLGRVTAFMDPWKNPTTSGYHIIQSLIAIGAGGIGGLGLGGSRQKYGMLPVPYTDSIFAVLGEELGLIGSCLVLVLFLLVAYRGLRTARLAADRFGSLLALGISCQMTFQAFLNIAVITATVPFTGITLPFVSYGGSSMLVSFAAMGILLNVTKYTREHSPAPAGKEARSDTVDEPAHQDNDPAAAGRRRHRWPRLSGAGRGSGRPRPALVRG
ncbi:MAG: putative lipid II flippase FtsW [Chloroflexota bacterium]